MLRVLTMDDYKSVMDLFVECFRDDHYFRALYSDAADFDDRLRSSAASNIRYCIENGAAYGMFDVDRLVGFMLGFNYKWAQIYHRADFNSIFVGSNPTIHVNIGAIDGPVLYLMLVGVAPDWRRRGVASGLLEAIMSEYASYTIVGDVSAPESIPMYRTRGFHVAELEPDYFWVQL